MSKHLPLLFLTLAILSGCERVDPHSPQGQRQAIFQQMLRTSEDLGGMLRGRLPFDEQRFATGATALAALSQTPWQHFAPAAGDGQGNARAAVWERQAGFDQRARQLEAATTALVAVSRTRPLRPEDVQVPMDHVEAACRACHSEFRNH